MLRISPVFVLFFLAATSASTTAWAGSHAVRSINSNSVTILAEHSVAYSPAMATSSVFFSGTVDQVYDRITIPVDGGSTANIGATDFTIEMWLRPDATQNNGAGSAWWMGNIFLDRDILGNQPRSFGASLRSGQVTFMTHPAGGSQTLFTASTDIRDDSWHWVVITYDFSSGDVQIYIDGTREVNASGSSGDLSFVSSSNVKNRLIELGGEKHFQGTPAYVGYMSEIRFSDVVRYSGATISVPSSPLAVDADTVTYWGFTEGSGSVLTDSAPGSADGTVVFGGMPQAPVWSAEAPYAGGSAGVVQFSSATSSVDEAETSVTASVIRSGGSAGAASVDVATSPGTATPGADYQTAMSQLTWADGQQGPRNVTVTLLPDSQPESDETFTLTLTNANGASLGTTQVQTVTIVDDDVASPPGTLQFSSATYSVGEAGASVALTVTRTGGSAGALSADYDTQNISATAGSDYTAATGTVSFADGDTASKTITIDILDDGVDESDETFQVSLSGSSLGAPAVATVTIVDDDAPGAPGTLQFSSATYSVGEAGTSVELTVTRLGGSTGALDADYDTQDVSASAGSDYTAATGTVSFADGDTAPKTFTVDISNDTADEGNETFQVSLSGASVGSPAVATVTIVDDDMPAPPGTLQFSPSSYSVNENGTNVELIVSRTGGSTGQISADYTTEEVSARAGSDYTARSGTLTFADGDTTPQTITITVLDDSVDESNESFRVVLSGASVGTPDTATVTIVDNDSAPPPNQSSGGGGTLSLMDLLLLLSALASAVSRRSRRPA